MKNNLQTLFLALVLLATAQTQLQAQGTAFTYQGRLNFNGSPAAGNFDLAFTLFATNTTGVAIAAPVTNSATAVTNGLFTVTLDFGAGIFTGPNRWLEISARTNGGGAFTTLAPRQPLTPTPYAIFANTASNVLGVIPSSQITGTISPAQLPANVITNTQVGVTLGGTFSGNGSGLTNLNASALATGTVPTNVLAGFQAPYYAFIGGGQNNTALNTYAVVAGGANNNASYLAAAGGGYNNNASGYYATIPGGYGNTASGLDSFAAGQQAQAVHQGAFVWADSQPAAFASAGRDTFNVRAGGGVNFQTAGSPITVNGQNVLTGAGNFWQTTGNAGTSPTNGNFLGTTDNQPLELRVNNIRTLRLELNSGSGGAPNVIIGSTANQVLPGVYGATISGGGDTNIGTNSVTGIFGTIGGGFGNTASFDATVSGGHGNSAGGQDDTIGGGDNNLASNREATVSGGGGNRALGGGSTVGGGVANKANAPGAFIGGGGYDGVYVYGNRADAPASAIMGGGNNLIATNGSWSAIAGGYGNNVNGSSSAIGGGYGNIISNNANYCGIGGGYGNYISAQDFFTLSGAAIGGGIGNTIDTNGAAGFIGGGDYNYLNAPGATIGGGSGNFATGNFATIPGGDNNVASGFFSFAAGYFASAVHPGAFVWADSTGNGFTSTTSNQFAVYSTGGVLLNAGTNNVEIASGGLKVTGAGINTGTTAFTHLTSPGTIAGNQTTINNPFCNNDPNAILIVTHNYNPGGASVSTLHNHPVGVFYSVGKWKIYNDDLSNMVTNIAFNVLVVKH